HTSGRTTSMGVDHKPCKVVDGSPATIIQINVIPAQTFPAWHSMLSPCLLSTYLGSPWTCLRDGIDVCCMRQFLRMPICRLRPKRKLREFASGTFEEWWLRDWLDINTVSAPSRSRGRSCRCRRRRRSCRYQKAIRSCGQAIDLAKRVLDDSHL